MTLAVLVRKVLSMRGNCSFIANCIFCVASHLFINKVRGLLNNK